MSKITPTEVAQISQLARLELTEEEIKKFQNELSGILTYAEQIQAIETADILPTAQITGLTGVVREDIKVQSKLSPDEIFENTPEVKDGYIKTAAVLD